MIKQNTISLMDAEYPSLSMHRGAWATELFSQCPNCLRLGHRKNTQNAISPDEDVLLIGHDPSIIHGRCISANSVRPSAHSDGARLGSEIELRSVSQMILGKRIISIPISHAALKRLINTGTDYCFIAKEFCLFVLKLSAYALLGLSMLFFAVFPASGRTRSRHGQMIRDDGTDRERSNDREKEVDEQCRNFDEQVRNFDELRRDFDEHHHTSEEHPYNQVREDEHRQDLYAHELDEIDAYQKWIDEQVAKDNELAFKLNSMIPDVHYADRTRQLEDDDLVSQWNHTVKDDDKDGRNFDKNAEERKKIASEALKKREDEERRCRKRDSCFADWQHEEREFRQFEIKKHRAEAKGDFAEADRQYRNASASAAKCRALKEEWLRYR